MPYLCLNTLPHPPLPCLQLTIQGDVSVPPRLLSGMAQDAPRLSALAAALAAAAAQVMAGGRGAECRVLVCGGCMGVIPLIALRTKGVTHVTVVERCVCVGGEGVGGGRGDGGFREGRKGGWKREGAERG